MVKAELRPQAVRFLQGKMAETVIRPRLQLPVALVKAVVAEAGATAAAVAAAVGTEAAAVIYRAAAADRDILVLILV